VLTSPTPAPATAPPIVLGIDGAKDHLDLAVLPAVQAPWQICYDAASLAQLLGELTAGLYPLSWTPRHWA
jgi:hypothetical protein